MVSTDKCFLSMRRSTSAIFSLIYSFIPNYCSIHSIASHVNSVKYLFGNYKKRVFPGLFLCVFQLFVIMEKMFPLLWLETFFSNTQDDRRNKLMVYIGRVYFHQFIKFLTRPDTIWRTLLSHVLWQKQCQTAIRLYSYWPVSPHKWRNFAEVPLFEQQLQGRASRYTRNAYTKHTRIKISMIYCGSSM